MRLGKKSIILNHKKYPKKLTNYVSKIKPEKKSIVESKEATEDKKQQLSLAELDEMQRKQELESMILKKFKAEKTVVRDFTKMLK